MLANGPLGSRHRLRRPVVVRRRSGTASVGVAAAADAECRSCSSAEFELNILVWKPSSGNPAEKTRWYSTRESM